MIRDALRLAGVAIVPTLALVGVVLVAPGRARLAVHVYVLVLCLFSLIGVVGALRQANPRARVSAFDRALRRRPPRHDRLAELARLEREVALGTASAFDLHYRLRPTARRVARGLLAARRGIDLDHDADGARRVLGDETYELVRPDRAPPLDRFGPGLEPAGVHRLVEALEEI